MLIKALLKRDLKISFKLWLIITAVMSLLLFALFFATNGTAGGIMIIQQFYTLFAALIPVFYIASTSTKLIAAQVDNGSFSYVMSSPLKRSAVAITQAFFLIVSIVLMYSVFCGIGLISFALWGQFMPLGTFLLLNLGSMLLNLVIAGIGYFATCCVNSASKATSVALGLPLGFFLFYVVGTFFGSNDLLKILKFFTIHSMYNATDIIAQNTAMFWQFGGFAVMALVLFVAGLLIFKKKDLPL